MSELTRKDREYWEQLLKAYRSRNGLSQAALGTLLGVDQTTVSRWERTLDAPSIRQRKRIRDLMRRSQMGRQDHAMRMRVRNALWPSSLMGRGAVFLEASPQVVTEAHLPFSDLRGMSVYGAFGDQTDAVTERWEQAGIFEGDLAMAVTVNVLNPTVPGRTTYIQTLDTPYFSTEGEIWCVCEIRRIDETRYRRFIAECGANSLLVPFEGL